MNESNPDNWRGVKVNRYVPSNLLKKKIESGELDVNDDIVIVNLLAELTMAFKDSYRKHVVPDMADKITQDAIAIFTERL